jgi:hypothetical protein
VPVADALLADIPALKVVGICTCWCRSIYFESESRKDQRLADTWGRTARKLPLVSGAFGSSPAIQSISAVRRQNSPGRIIGIV